MDVIKEYLQEKACLYILKLCRKIGQRKSVYEEVGLLRT